MGMRHVLPLLLAFGMVFSACVPLDYYDKAEVSSISVSPTATNPDNSTTYGVSLFATISGHNVPVKNAVIFIQPFNTTGFRKEYLCRTITDENGTATFVATPAMMNKTTFVAVFCYSNASLACAIDDCLVVFDDNGNIGYKPSYPSPNGIGMASYKNIQVCNGVSDALFQDKNAQVFNLTGDNKWDNANLFLSSSMVLTRASGTRVLSTDQLSICLPISILLGLLIASMFYMGVNPFFWFSMDRTQRAYIKPDTKAIQSSLTSGLSQHENLLTSVVNKAGGVVGAAGQTSNLTNKAAGGLQKTYDKITPATKKGFSKVLATVAKGAVGVALVTTKAPGALTNILSAPAKMAGAGQAKMVANAQLKAGVMAKTGEKMKLAKAAGATTAQTKAIMAQGRQAAGQISAATKGMGGAISKMIIGSMLYLVLRTYGLAQGSISAYTRQNMNLETNNILKTLQDKKMGSTYVAALSVLVNKYTSQGMTKEEATAKAQKEVDVFVKSYESLQLRAAQLGVAIQSKILEAKTVGAAREILDMQKDLKSLTAERDALCRNTLGMGFADFSGKASAVADQLKSITKSTDIARSFGQELGNTIAMKARLMYMNGEGDKAKTLLDSFNSTFIPGALTVDVVAQIVQYFPPSEREQVAKSVEKVRLDFEKVSQKISVTKFDSDANRNRSIQETVSRVLDTALNSGDARASEKAMEQIRSSLGGSEAGKDMLRTIEATYKAKAELFVSLAKNPEIVNDACVKNILTTLGQPAGDKQISNFKDSVEVLKWRATEEAATVASVIDKMQKSGYAFSYNADAGTLEVSTGGKQMSQPAAERLLRDFGVSSSISPAVAANMETDAHGAIDSAKTTEKIKASETNILSNMANFIREREQTAVANDNVLAKLNRLDEVLQEKGMKVTGFDKTGAVMISDKEGNPVTNASVIRNQFSGTAAQPDFESAMKTLADSRDSIKELGEGRGKGGSNPVNDVREALIIQVKSTAEMTGIFAGKNAEMESRIFSSSLSLANSEAAARTMFSSSNQVYSMTKSVENDIFGTIVGIGSSGTHINSIYKDYADLEHPAMSKADTYNAQRDYMDYMHSNNLAVTNPNLAWSGLLDIDHRNDKCPGLIPYLLGDYGRKTEEPKPYEKPPAREIAPLVEQPKEPERRPVQIPREPEKAIVSYSIKSGDSIWEINRHAIEQFYPKFSEMSPKDQTKTLVAMENHMKNETEENLRKDFGLEKSREGEPGYKKMTVKFGGELRPETHGLEAGTTLSLNKSVYEEALKVALPDALKSKLEVGKETGVAAGGKPVEVTAQKKETAEKKIAEGGPEKPPKKPPAA